MLHKVWPGENTKTPKLLSIILYALSCTCKGKFGKIKKSGGNRKKKHNAKENGSCTTLVSIWVLAVKLLLMQGDGQIANIVSREYPIAFPHPGWSEQNPADWWDAVCAGIPELLNGFDASQVAGIGAGGQMHGLVVLDAQDKVIRPCILWNDGRTQKQVEYLNNVIGKENLSKYTANIAFAGFTAPKLLWMRDTEPENFTKISKIMLPKDYINYKLTGVHCTDYSDASGMLLLDVQHKCWSKEMLDICGVSEAKMPKLFESWEPVGTLTAEAAAKLGLPEGVRSARAATMLPLLLAAALWATASATSRWDLRYRVHHQQHLWCGQAERPAQL